MIVAPASSGRAAIRSATPKPSRSGMLASSSTSDERIAVLRRRRAARRAPLAAAVDRRRLHLPARQLLVEDPAVDRVVVDDQHRQVGEQRLGARRVRQRRDRRTGA